MVVIKWEVQVVHGSVKFSLHGDKLFMFRSIFIFIDFFFKKSIIVDKQTNFVPASEQMPN